MNKNQLDKFWNEYDLEANDWFGKDFSFDSRPSTHSIRIGLTSKLLQELFCRDFLTPLEQTDVFYSLKVIDILR